MARIVAGFSAILLTYNLKANTRAMVDDWRSVNWSSMTHAFGSAQDVPRIMQRILETNGEERRGFIERLTDYIIHQGELHSPAPYVLDFFVLLLKSDNLPDKSDVLWAIFLLSGTAPNFSRKDIDIRTMLDKIDGTLTEHMDLFWSLVESNTTRLEERIHALDIVDCNDERIGQRVVEWVLSHLATEVDPKLLDAMFDNIVHLHFQGLESSFQTHYLQQLEHLLASGADHFLQIQLLAVLVKWKGVFTSTFELSRLIDAAAKMCSASGNQDHRRLLQCSTLILFALKELSPDFTVDVLTRILTRVSNSECLRLFLDDLLQAANLLLPKGVAGDLHRRRALYAVYALDLVWHDESLSFWLKQNGMPTDRKAFGAMLLSD